MLSIYRPSVVHLTPLHRLDVRWEADAKGFKVTSIEGTVYSQPAQGVVKFERSYEAESLSDLGDDVMETVIADIQSQIASCNWRFGAKLGDMPRLTMIEGRAISPQEVA